MKRTSLLPKPRVIVLGSLALLMAGTVFATLGPNPWATLRRISDAIRGASHVTICEMPPENPICIGGFERFMH